MPRVPRPGRSSLALGLLVIAARPAAVAESPPARETTPAALIESGRPRLAIERLQSETADPASRILLGRALAGVGRYAEAEAALAEPAGSEHEATRLATLARILEDTGRVDQALDTMTRAVASKKQALGPKADSVEAANDLAELQTRLGEMALRAGKLDLAREPFQAAVNLVNAAHMKLHQLGVPHDERDPRLFAAAATAGLAQVFAATGDDRRAERTWRAVAARTDDPAILASLGAYHLAKGDVKAATRAFDRIAKAAANNPRHRRVLALFLADHAGKPKEALAVATAAMDDGGDVRDRDALAWAWFRCGDPAKADAILRPALEAGTQDPLILFHAGRIAQALGRGDESRRWLAKALQVLPAFDPLAAKEARAALDGVGAP